MQLLHREYVTDRAQQHDIRLAPGGPAAHGGPPGLFERLGEQSVRPAGAPVGCQVVGFVEIDRVYRLDRYEFRDLLGMGAGLLEGLDLIRGEGHVLILGELVTLHHVVTLDDGAVLRADVLLFEPRSASLVQEIERDCVAGLGRRVELHGNCDESEGDCQGSNRARGHGTPAVMWVGPIRQTPKPKTRDKLYLLNSASCHRSAVFSNRAGTLAIVKSITSAASRSSQVSGIETRAPGCPRGE